ncbi:hypothetical protein [Tateyamaria sp. SN6-1]|uniref:hypothetical protein n=1 Tax=Tateyamaria sp. SN6-1 TaxID=3092148 RepID=UPI0039F4ABA4
MSDNDTLWRTLSLEHKIRCFAGLILAAWVAIVGTDVDGTAHAMLVALTFYVIGLEFIGLLVANWFGYERLSVVATAFLFGLKRSKLFLAALGAVILAVFLDYLTDF